MEFTSKIYTLSPTSKANKIHLPQSGATGENQPRKGVSPLASIKNSRFERAVSRSAITADDPYHRWETLAPGDLSSPTSFSPASSPTSPDGHLRRGLSPGSRFSPKADSVKSTDQLRAMQFEKTKPCRFFKLGTCTKRDLCPFAHNRTEQRPLPDLEKTKMCVTMLETGTCSNKHCSFAHTKDELRATDSFLKTKMCKHYSSPGSYTQQKKCHMGRSCRYAHSEQELRHDLMLQQEQMALLAANGLAVEQAASGRLGPLQRVVSPNHSLESTSSTRVSSPIATLADMLPSTEQELKSKRNNFKNVMLPVEKSDNLPPSIGRNERTAGERRMNQNSPAKVEYYCTFDDSPQVSSSRLINLSDVLDMEDKVQQSKNLPCQLRGIDRHNQSSDDFYGYTPSSSGQPSISLFPETDREVIQYPGTPRRYVSPKAHSPIGSTSPLSGSIPKSTPRVGVKRVLQQFEIEATDWADVFSSPDTSPCSQVSFGFQSPLARSADSPRFPAMEIRSTPSDPMLADGSPARSRRKMFSTDSPMLSCGSPVRSAVRSRVSVSATFSALQEATPVQISVTNRIEFGNLVERANLVEVQKSIPSDVRKPPVVMNTFLHYQDLSPKVTPVVVLKPRSKSLIY